MNIQRNDNPHEISQEIKRLTLQLHNIQFKCDHKDAICRYDTNTLSEEIPVWLVYTCPTCLVEWIEDINNE